jgi:hypothetical protein
MTVRRSPAESRPILSSAYTTDPHFKAVGPNLIHRPGVSFGDLAFPIQPRCPSREPNRANSAGRHHQCDEGAADIVRSLQAVGRAHSSRGMAGQQGRLDAIRYAAGFVPAAFILVAIAIMYFYPLTEARFTQIVAETAQRRAARHTTT